MVFETIREMLAECLGCDESRIQENTIILEDLEATPEDLGEVLMGMEEEFGVSVPEEALTRISTVADLVRFVEDQM